ncbi:MAG: Zn-ribbon domain-containing OB-fold protein [Halieaceae bacterium]|uniref:Zn-ribbon domain-containing OB-fold protein n=1 Tax=Haliea alexandrii TaxID=2448162 RepID=UPI000F0B964B|nr:Zn-ribbon domain-containing OB-fold protein [Haliea alexandrii]MCR9187128.1 Zn-ribbon domain-containing OB-fold protein [Halieaceae bacterium]
MAQSFRMKPPMGEDNGWWWQQAAEGNLAIQRCKACSTLRHPPRPMCGDCQSLEWDHVVASGRGTLDSFTVLHHPQFPGFDYPLIIILVKLEEGTRFTSQLINCSEDAVEFGMPVEMVMHEDPDGFRLPMFQPAQGAHA